MKKENKFKKVVILLTVFLLLVAIDYFIVWPYLKTTFMLFLTCVLAFTAPALPVYLIIKTLSKEEKPDAIK